MAVKYRQGWMLRRSEAYKRLAAELDRLGIDFEIDAGGTGGGHPALVFEYRGRPLKKFFASTPGDDKRGHHKAVADLHRLMADVDRRLDGDQVPTREDLPMPETALQIIDRGTEPRILDSELGIRLGFSRPTKIRELINRHIEKLKEISDLPERGKSGVGRPAGEYLLNEEQAVYIINRSDTQAAAELRDMLIEQFANWRRNRMRVGLDEETIGGIVKAVVRKALTDFGLEDIRAAQELILERLAGVGDRIAPVKPQHVTAYEIIGMVGIPTDHRHPGLAGQVSKQMSAFSARRGFLVSTLKLHPGEKLAFLREAAVEWLAAGGRQNISAWVAAHRDRKQGQGRLKLVPPATLT